MNHALKPVITVLKHISDFLDLICRKACLIIGIVLVVDLFLGVFTRFILSAPLSFTEEIARYCMLWFAFIGGSVELKKAGLISFTFLVDKLNPKAKRVMEIIDTLFVIVFLVIFLYVGKDAMKVFGFGKASITKINLAWTAAGIYVGTAIMLIHSVYQLLLKVTGTEAAELEKEG